jgi:hypothetical protein
MGGLRCSSAGCIQRQLEIIGALPSPVHIISTSQPGNVRTLSSCQYKYDQRIAFVRRLRERWGLNRDGTTF